MIWAHIWLFHILLCDYSISSGLAIEGFSYSHDEEINHQVIHLDSYRYRSYANYLTKKLSKSYQFTVELSTTFDGLFVILYEVGKDSTICETTDIQLTLSTGEVGALCDRDGLRLIPPANTSLSFILVDVMPRKFHLFGRRRFSLSTFSPLSPRRFTKFTVGAIVFTSYSNCSDPTRNSTRTLASCSAQGNNECIESELFCDNDINCIPSLDDPDNRTGFDENFANCDWKAKNLGSSSSVPLGIIGLGIIGLGIIALLGLCYVFLYWRTRPARLNQRSQDRSSQVFAM